LGKITTRKDYLLSTDFSVVKSDWRPYENFPTLVGKAKVISFDVETYDPNLKDKGPGALRKDGFICGFSVATDDGFCGYYPIKHAGGDNLPDPAKAIRWLKDQLSDNTPKVGANLLYDVIWLKCDLDIRVRGKLYDVQVAEPLLDENRWTYSLDSLAETWLKENKVEELLYEVGVKCFGYTPTAKKKYYGDEELGKKKDIITQVKSHIWELPARHIGAYGEADATLPIRIFNLQREELHKRGLWKLFDEVETEILDLLLEMWLKGVPIDVDKAEQVKDQLQLRYDGCMRKIRHRVGKDIDIWSAPSCAEACQTLGLVYPLTDKENASFKAEWLQEQDHDFFKLLLEARQLDRSGSVFVESKILNMEINGRIHPQFWQVKTERYGTGSGRFSSSNPNAQQFPARNEELARLVRSLLCAEDGAEWAIADWSQQEPRVTVHYAVLMGLRGAEEAMRKYIDNPDTDYHQMVADMTGLKRKTAKTVNLGLSYGMGAKKYSEKYGCTIQEAKAIFKTYHQGLPFIKELTDQCQRTVEHRGYIKTLLGRHCHFDLYGPPNWTEGKTPLVYEDAVKAYGQPVVRYFTYRAMNRLVQGSSADMVKKAMVDCYRAGYIPCLTVHDELDFCDITETKQLEDIRDIMLNCVKLRVPLKLDMEVGPNWGECEEVML
jgi:DNA polymerase I-like protein with 3'-5' exonuclease and polymerase domains